MSNFSKENRFSLFPHPAFSGGAHCNVYKQIAARAWPRCIIYVLSSVFTVAPHFLLRNVCMMKSKRITNQNVRVTCANQLIWIVFNLFNRKSPSRGNRSRRRKRNRNCAVNNHDQLSNINRIEILPNASKFAVFSAIRAIVMESESKSQSLFDILENNKKLQCHQAAKQQDVDTDAESIMGDVTEKQQITMAIPQVRKDFF